MSGPVRRVAVVVGSIAAILVVVRLAAGVAGFSGSDDSALPEPTQPTTTAVSSPTAAVSEDPDVTTTADPSAPRRNGTDAGDELDLFVTERFGDYRIIYESTTGLGLVGSDVAVVSAPVRVEAYSEISGFELFTSRKRTWAIDPTDPLTSFVVTNRNVVVETATPGNYAFIDHTSRSNDGRPLIGLVAAGMAGPSHDVPEGASAFAVDGVGVLLAADDGTQLLRGARLEPFSDHRVVAALSTGWAERRCVGDSCRLALVTESDDERSERTFQRVTVPEEAEAILSPDLAWLVYPSVDGGQTEVWNLDEGFRSSVPLAVPADAAWSPDSQFFAWTEQGRLVAVFPATGEVVEPELPFDAIDGSVKILVG